MADYKPPATLHQHHPVEGTPSWFLHEFWPLLLFGGMFLLMMTIPLVLTGTLTLQGLVIFKALLFSVMLALTLPRLLPIFLLVMAGVVFGVQPGAIQVGLSIAVCFIAFTVIGMIWLPQRRRLIRDNRQD
jgi:ABC-type transport system involved in Fe-S cluster assembly fused permease/ATPase subunit